MIGFLASPKGSFALAQVPEALLPGRRVRADGRLYDVAGAIVCVDAVEAWLECLLDAGDGRPRWLAVEVCGNGYRTTLWERTVESEPPVVLRDRGSTVGAVEGIESIEGTASYRSRGEFDGYPIPATGVLTYRESHGATATAAEQFVADGPWLVGRGDGADVVVETISS
jgi:hypothetical protein